MSRVHTSLPEGNRSSKISCEDECLTRAEIRLYHTKIDWKYASTCHVRLQRDVSAGPSQHCLSGEVRNVQ